jgi:hypothetical protein
MGFSLHFERTEPVEVWSRNLTYNLCPMMREAGVYDALVEPHDVGITKAHQLVKPLKAGLRKLKRSSAKYKKFNPPNGWGTYEGLITFIEDTLVACKEYPDAEVKSWG